MNKIVELKKIEGLDINKNILVTVQSSYIPAQSDVVSQKFVWSYEVTIDNQSESIIQLLGRCWWITDMSGKVDEIRGPGVIGLQPIIKPGRPFTYISYCQLMTPQGTMEGHYVMQNLEDVSFAVEIPKFVLSAPTSITQPFRCKLH